MCLYKGAIPQAPYNIGQCQKSGVIDENEKHIMEDSGVRTLEPRPEDLFRCREGKVL